MPNNWRCSAWFLLKSGESRHPHLPDISRLECEEDRDRGRILQAMRRIIITLGSLLLVALVSAGAPVSANPSSNTSTLIDSEEDCLEPVPASHSVTGITDDAKPLSLDVLVLLDDVDRARGKEVMDKAAEPYAPLEISLDVRFEEVAFPSEASGAEEPTSTADYIIQQAEQWTMGNRPADVDVVYVITNQILSDAAGKADCIGGVRWSDGAYGVGENYKSENLLGLFYKNGTAKIAAHEIGHLMGAHHHYANCTEGIPGAVAEAGPTPCTTMFPYMDTQSLVFSSLEGAVIRGHTIEFASAGPDVDPVFSSTVTFSPRNGVARGEVGSTEARCQKQAKVAIQSYSGEDGWVTLAETTTNRKGRYKVRVPQSNLRRAYVPQSQFEDAGKSKVCAQSASPPL